MKVRFVLYKKERMYDSIADNAIWVRGTEDAWYGDFFEGWDEFEIEVDELSDVKVFDREGEAYEAEATEPYRCGDEWIPFVTVWRPVC